MNHLLVLQSDFGLSDGAVAAMEGVALSKEKNGLPKTEDRVWTNFTR